jgi:predicted MFS family arabinose efflux permease
MKSPLISKNTEYWMIGILVAVQFTHIVDFVVLMPLGPKLFREFDINTTQFGLLVSAYTFSAAFSSILASLFLDKLDRKKALLLLFAGFAISTLMCALSGSYWPLMTARIMAGAFGGILTALSLSIIGDYVPIQRRGQAMGAVMSAFSIASVIGVPTGLWLAEAFDWHAPFFLLSITSIPLIIIAAIKLPAMELHLQTQQSKAWPRIVNILKMKGPQRAFLLMSVMMIAGFSIIPFISPYLVSNAGMAESNLSWLYLIGGIFTFGSSIISGKLSDTFGPMQVFRIAAVISIIPILILTQFEVVPLYQILIVTTLFMIFLSARLVPVISMVTGTVPPAQRGTFMSLLSSIQQMSSGIAAYVAGLIITETASGKIMHYERVGYMASIATLLAVYLGYKLRPFTQKNEPGASPFLNMHDAEETEPESESPLPA